jgi:hypothetical protein
MLFIRTAGKKNPSTGDERTRLSPLNFSAGKARDCGVSKEDSKGDSVDFARVPLFVILETLQNMEGLLYG